MADGWVDRSAPTGCAWESLAPGPELSRLLAMTDPSTLSPDARVSYLAATERLAGWVYTLQASALVAVSDAVKEATAGERGSASMQQSWVADEIAAALHISTRTATIRVNAGTAVMRDWPALGEAIATGRLSVAQAREVYEGASALSGTLSEAGEDLSEVAVRELVRIARDLPPARLRERVARVVASLDPAGATRRRERAERDRTDVIVWGEPDGMACLSARGPAVDSVAMRELIDQRAKAMRAAAGDDDGRTIGQWRHAALLAAFGLTTLSRSAGPTCSDIAPTATPESAPGPHSCDTCGSASAPIIDRARVELRVTVPLTTLLDLTDSPGELEGYGPLDPDLVRALASDAEWVRWVTDPVGDYLLDSGSRRFPGARLARFLRDREGRCKHPSCGVRSRNCDADHLPAFSAGGRTSATGMSPTCPRHNRHRDASGWKAGVDGPADPYGPPEPTWISPLGRRYETAVSRPLALDFIPLRT